MEDCVLQSVQLYDCTDKLKRQITRRFAYKTEGTHRTDKSYRLSDSKRFSHRALHSLWETKLQMCQRKRTWSEILSFSELSWTKTRAAICSARESGKGKGISEQLSDVASITGRNLQNKQGNPKTERKIVKGRYEYYWKSFNSHRPRNGSNIGFKYAQGSTICRVGRNFYDGGRI